MILAAFDVHYLEDGRASAAAVLFSDYVDTRPSAVYEEFLSGAAGYLPGEFYRRELPGILALINKFDRAPDEMIVDGYVMLGDRPGLGYHLFSALGGKIPVIGVAKSKYKGSAGIEVFRGRSVRPLYVTSAGMDPNLAAEKIRMMHGAYRLPTLLKRVDRLARGAAFDTYDWVMEIRGNRFEKLSGTRKGQFSLRINDRYRICFRWEKETASEVEIIDYH